MPENADKKEDGRFRKGQSGNPAGKPKGARHQATLAIEALLEGEAERIGRKCVDMALGGDPVAMRLALERICPVRRGRPVSFDLPEQLETTADLSRALGTVLSATATGELTPEEAGAIAHIIDARRRAIETVELEQRLAALEGSAK